MASDFYYSATSPIEEVEEEFSEDEGSPNESPKVFYRLDSLLSLLVHALLIVYYDQKRPLGAKWYRDVHFLVMEYRLGLFMFFISLGSSPLPLTTGK